MSISRITLLTAALALSACNNNVPADRSDDSGSIEAEQQQTPSEETGNMDTDRALESFATEAISDLAGRLEIEPSGIELAEAKFVTWPNSALGCPESDMMYTQALVPGYRIRLVADGRTYAYHGAEGQPPFHCPAERAGAPAAVDGNSRDVR